MRYLLALFPVLAFGQVTGTGTIRNDDQVQTLPDSDIVLSVGPGHTATSNDLVAFGIPFEPGELSTCANLRILDDSSQEVAAFVAERRTWGTYKTAGDATVRACEVQFFTDMTGGSKTFNFDISQPRTQNISQQSRALAETTSVYDSEYPRVVALLECDRYQKLYDGGFECNPPAEQLTFIDGEYADLSGEDYETGPEGVGAWLYDRPSTYAKYAAVKQDATIMAEAYRSGTYYTERFDTDGTQCGVSANTGAWAGSTDGSCPRDQDQKYTYLEPCLVATGWFGDATRCTDTLISAAADYLVSGSSDVPASWLVWDTIEACEDEGQTERQLAIPLEGVAWAYSMLGTASYLTNINTAITNLRDHQLDSPDVAGTTNYGIHVHDMARHEQLGNAAACGTNIDGFSPWMTALLVKAVEAARPLVDSPTQTTIDTYLIDLVTLGYEPYAWTTQYVIDTSGNPTDSEWFRDACNSGRNRLAPLYFASVYPGVVTEDVFSQSNDVPFSAAESVHLNELLSAYYIAYSRGDAADKALLRGRIMAMEDFVSQCDVINYPQTTRSFAWRFRQAFEALSYRESITGAEIHVERFGDVYTSDDYGTFDQNTGDICRTYWVHNYGDTSLTSVSASVPTGFTIIGGLSSTIPAASREGLVVCADDDTAGSFSGNVTISSSDADEPSYTWSVSSVVNSAGEPEIFVEANSSVIADGGSGNILADYAENQSPTSTVVTVNNIGSSNLTTSNLTTSSECTVTEGLNATIAPSGSDNFTIQAAETTQGNYVCTVSFDNNDSNEDPFNFGATYTVDPPLVAGDIDFETISAAFFSGSDCDPGQSFGVLWPDLDADGWPDLLQNDHNPEPNRRHCWLTSNGDGTFDEISSAATDYLNAYSGNSRGGWTDQSIDVNGDLKPDIYMRGNEPGQYLFTNTSVIGGAVSFTTARLPGSVEQDNYSHYIADYDGDGSMASLGNANTVRDIGTGSTISTLGGGSFRSVLYVNDDTYPDVINSSGVWLNDGDGTFTLNSISAFSICITDARFAGNWDIDQDGDLDVVCGVPREQIDALHVIRNDNGSWTRLGSNIERLTNTNEALIDLYEKGGQDIGDLDNDKLPDLVMPYVLPLSGGSGGKVYRYQGSGQFEQINEGDLGIDFEADDDSCFSGNPSVAVEDYDLDGLEDIANGHECTNSYGHLAVNRNITVSTNEWVKVTLDGRNMGAGDNGQGFGAFVKVYQAGGAYIQGRTSLGTYKINRESSVIHIGLGEVSGNIDIEVIWPSGFEASQKFTNLAVNQAYKVVYVQSGNDTITTWTPGSGY